MPLPTPKKNEKKTDFVARCMRELNNKKEFKDQGQRYAVCNTQWSKKQ